MLNYVIQDYVRYYNERARVTYFNWIINTLLQTLKNYSYLLTIGLNYNQQDLIYNGYCGL